MDLDIIYQYGCKCFDAGEHRCPFPVRPDGVPMEIRWLVDRYGRLSYEFGRFDAWGVVPDIRECFLALVRFFHDG